MIIDSHLHVWNLQRAAYSWLGPHLPEVNRDIAFEEIAPVLTDLSIGGVILVQSADNAEDTRNMLHVAATRPEIFGVVGWVPVEDPGAIASHLDDLLRYPEIVGIRNLIHDRTDPDWVLRPAFDDGLSILEEYGLPFDFVTSNPEAIPRLVTAAGRHPGLTFVLDHLVSPRSMGRSKSTGAGMSSLPLPQSSRTSSRRSRVCMRPRGRQGTGAYLDLPESLTLRWKHSERNGSSTEVTGRCRLPLVDIDACSIRSARLCLPGQPMLKSSSGRGRPRASTRCQNPTETASTVKSAEAMLVD